MKTRLLILVFLILTFSIYTPCVLRAEEGQPEITTKELPSVTYLKKEKRSIAASTTTAPLSSPIQSLRSPRSSGWQDPDFEFGGNLDDGNIGHPAPIGDATLPVLISIILLYMTYRYRNSTTSKRRNNL